MPDLPEHNTTIIVVLRARVSTADTEQGLDRRLLRLSDFCDAQGWSICKKYVDKASTANFTVRIITEKIGRRRVTDRQDFHARYKTILERLQAGDISRRRAARELDVGYATLKRLLDSDYSP